MKLTLRRGRTLRLGPLKIKRTKAGKIYRDWDFGVFHYYGRDGRREFLLGPFVLAGKTRTQRAKVARLKAQAAAQRARIVSGEHQARRSRWEAFRDRLDAFREELGEIEPLRVLPPAPRADQEAVTDVWGRPLDTDPDSPTQLRRAGLCGQRTEDGTPCRRRGRCRAGFHDRLGSFPH